MKKILILLVVLIILSCSKSNDPAAGIKLAGTTWVAEYSTDPNTGAILYNRYRFTTDKDVVSESYYRASNIISSIDHTYTYNPPKLVLTHDGFIFQNEVVGNKIVRGQIEYIRQ